MDGASNFSLRCAWLRRSARRWGILVKAAWIGGGTRQLPRQISLDYQARALCLVVYGGNVTG